MADSVIRGRHGGAAGEETWEYQGAEQHLHLLHLRQRLPHRWTCAWRWNTRYISYPESCRTLTTHLYCSQVSSPCPSIRGSFTNSTLRSRSWSAAPESSRSRRCRSGAHTHARLLALFLFFSFFFLVNTLVLSSPSGSSVEHWLGSHHTGYIWRQPVVREYGRPVFPLSDGQFISKYFHKRPPLFCRRNPKMCLRLGSILA